MRTNERIVCVEVIEVRPKRALVQHLFWKSMAWLPIESEYGPRILSGTKTLLVFDSDLDYGNIPHIPPTQKYGDFIRELLKPPRRDGYLSSRYTKLD